MGNEIVKPNSLSVGKPRPGSLRERLETAKAIQAGGLETIQLLLDCSGSMSSHLDGPDDALEKTRMAILHTAVSTLIKETDLSKYQIGIITFPSKVAFVPPTNSSFMQIGRAHV